MGATLADELGTYRADISRIAYVARELLAQLGALHEAGRRHPALTPADISIVGELDEPRLASVATPLAREAPYAAPETIADGALTVASNLYSVAAIVKALLGGRLHPLGDGWLDVDPTRRPPTAQAMLQQLGDLGWNAHDGDRVAARRCAYAASDPAERDLLAALRANPRDTATRDVYADWLEGRGEVERAAWLRGAAGAPGEPTWRALLARGTITNCLSSSCPRTWDALTPAFDNMRECRACQALIGYCTSELEAELFGRRDHVRFIVDDALEREVALAAFRRSQRRYSGNPPRPTPLPLPANPPRPEQPSGDDTTVLGRFFGWFRRR